MALSEFSRKVVIIRNNFFEIEKNRRKREWVHEISNQILTFGEFYRLYSDVRFHPDKFKDYLRMSKETFDTQGFFGFHISSFKHRTDNLLLHLKQNKRGEIQHCWLTGASHGLALGV
jgi:hypothetical protein